MTCVAAPRIRLSGMESGAGSAKKCRPMVLGTKSKRNLCQELGTIDSTRSSGCPPPTCGIGASWPIHKPFLLSLALVYSQAVPLCSHRLYDPVHIRVDYFTLRTQGVTEAEQRRIRETPMSKVSRLDHAWSAKVRHTITRLGTQIPVCSLQ
jgi:hypothetical protein